MQKLTRCVLVVTLLVFIHEKASKQAGRCGEGGHRICFKHVDELRSNISCVNLGQKLLLSKIKFLTKETLN